MFQLILPMTWEVAAVIPISREAGGLSGEAGGLSDGPVSHRKGGGGHACPGLCDQKHTFFTTELPHFSFTSTPHT